MTTEQPGFDRQFFEPLADVEGRSFWFQARNRLIVSVIRRSFPGATSLLEVGCGSGVVLAALHEQLPSLRLVGAELYDEGLVIARKRVPGAEFVALDARDLTYENEFDIVGAFDVLEHIDEDEEVLRRMVRAVRPGGGLLVLVPQHPRLWSEHDEFFEHRRRYTRAQLVAKAERAGIEVLNTTSFVMSLLPVLAALRLADRLRRRFDPIANLEPGPLNGIFERMLDGERKLIERGVSLPVGGSLMLVGRKPQLP
jgi:SAM-dependent methyltransferase